MIKSVKFLAAAAFSAGFVAHTALAEEREYDLPTFDKVDISTGIVLVANVGDRQKVVAHSDSDDFSDLKIEVDDGELHISREWSKLRWRKDKKSSYKVVVSMPEIRSVEASSGSHANIKNVSAPRLVVDLSSGAFAEVAGLCENCVVDLSSGANLDAKDLICDDARIDVSSGGHGVISVNNSLIADASSGGHVSVYGNPTRVNIDKSSGGRIKLKSGTAQAKND